MKGAIMPHDSPPEGKEQQKSQAWKEAYGKSFMFIRRYS